MCCNPNIAPHDVWKIASFESTALWHYETPEMRCLLQGLIALYISHYTFCLSLSSETMWRYVRCCSAEIITSCVEPEGFSATLFLESWANILYSFCYWKRNTLASINMRPITEVPQTSMIIALVNLSNEYGVALLALRLLSNIQLCMSWLQPIHRCLLILLV